MYTKLLKSITSLSLIGGALLYTNGSDVRAAEASIFLMCLRRIGRIRRLKIYRVKILFPVMEMGSLVSVMLRRESKLQL